MCSGLTLTNFESLGEERNDWSKESNVFAERKMIRHVLPSRRHHHPPVPVRSLKSLRLSSLLSPPTTPHSLKTPDTHGCLQALAGPNQFCPQGETPEPATWSHPPTQLPSHPIFSSSTRELSGFSPSTQSFHTSSIRSFIARTLIHALIYTESLK